MICFQKIVSLFWRTTLASLSYTASGLWFAFKKLYLCSDEQHFLSIILSTKSCDLLSKNCIFVLTNNKYLLEHSFVRVVICFQKIVSLFWRTTLKALQEKLAVLWFAFKKLYLCSDEQPTKALNPALSCCDLLSKNCIFVLTNNLGQF